MKVLWNESQCLCEGMEEALYSTQEPGDFPRAEVQRKGDER
jgi:hypothetical protein